MLQASTATPQENSKAGSPRPQGSTAEIERTRQASDPKPAGLLEPLYQCSRNRVITAGAGCHQQQISLDAQGEQLTDLDLQRALSGSVIDVDSVQQHRRTTLRTR